MGKSWCLDEEGFLLEEPYEWRPWINFLGNGSYGLRISHLGDGFSTTLAEPRRVVTNYDFFSPIKGRFLYVRDGGKLWNPSYYPAKTDLDYYSCRHGLGYTEFVSRNDGIEARSLHFLPENGSFEIWFFSARNLGRRERRLRLYPQAEFLLYESFDIDPTYYSWFTDSRLENDGKTLAFYKTDTASVYGFFASVARPDDFEASLSAFRGNGDMARPEALRKNGLSSLPSAGDPYIGCFGFDVALAPGGSWENAVFIGEGAIVLSDARARFPGLPEIKAEFSAVSRSWKEKCAKKECASIRDSDLRAYCRTFLPYQIFQQSKGLVRSIYRGYRDVAQDAMGLSYYDPAGARDLILTLLDKQYESGRCLRQWNTAGSFNDERDFRDLPLWLPIAVAKYIENTGDDSILAERGGFYKEKGGIGSEAEVKETATVFEHMVAGLKYSLRFGPHGLLLMGKGDWNDALSGLGPEGESLWLNQCAYLALGKLADFERDFGWRGGLDIEDLRDRLYRGVLAGWTGEWFLRGYHEKGRVIGGADRIFLLPQAWFTVSGMAERDPEKAEKALDSMVGKLGGAWGFLKCFPAFAAYDPEIGNMSALAPGTAENYAVYNHASAFAVYALFMRGRNEEALAYLNKLLPFRKDPAVTGSEPYVLVNFYNGGFYPAKAGRGGIPWLTSTVTWLAMSLFDYALPKETGI